ncbi:adenosylcobinamide amidohydrolase [Shimia sp. CNT1-13L.2]|uniref:adenosylcobinamide amidohydrolase n=1 Tax=Shimia sp. CNT1-13L.2 TaxID=2959663 RepID=UPI0020CC7192|nr:adenosylcobinamide amidohydrolase [Shimia sp. CNT1-13L.2]MCP9484083.1 adenosylcobinamide amidohydrolase [Shimia sp. CNT1-13L.2]
MSRVALDAPWLSFDLGADMQVLSWSLNAPGFTEANRILWREVRNRDLPPGADVHEWVSRELARRDASDAVLMLTSRDITFYEERRTQVGGVTVDALATVGLSNGERVGSRVDYSGRDWGTINVGVRISEGLTQAALIEAMSIAVQARTAAVMDAGFRLPTGIATGTGTDCVAIAAPKGSTPYAGLHTDTGEAIGRAVYDAVFAGAEIWINETKERQRARA